MSSRGQQCKRPGADESKSDEVNSGGAQARRLQSMEDDLERLDESLKVEKSILEAITKEQEQTSSGTDFQLSKLLSSLSTNIEKLKKDFQIIKHIAMAATMNPSLWSTLPDHLLDSILARLPMQSFFRFRVVSQSWNTRISSENFLNAYSGIPSQGPWILFFTPFQRNHVSIYNSTLNKWHRLPLCLPSTHPLSASDGGLVCYLSGEIGLESIVVSNPLTKSYRRLPPLFHGQQNLLVSVMSVTMLAMVVDRVTKHYKVVVAGFFEGFEAGGRYMSENVAGVYDSQMESWTGTANVPDASFNHNGRPSFASLTGKHVLSEKCLYIRCGSWQMLAYDLDQGLWTDPGSRLLRLPMMWPWGRVELLQWQGRILVAGELERAPCMVVNICIWEIQTKSLEPKEVDRLPLMLFKDFIGDNYYLPDDIKLDWCQAGKHVFLFKENLHGMRRPCTLLVYDLSQKSWLLLENFSPADLGGGGTQEILSGIAHEPRLDVNP